MILEYCGRAWVCQLEIWEMNLNGWPVPLARPATAAPWTPTLTGERQEPMIAVVTDIRMANAIIAVFSRLGGATEQLVLNEACTIAASVRKRSHPCTCSRTQMRCPMELARLL